MAGEVHQEPFSLSFQGNSIHSGSVSFGRFEKEGLSWEKRSSFSHNRYLEEVDKCSKPGSVTEMKAHFEAHFKKKGIRLPASLESQTWGVQQRGGEPDDDAVYATESFEDYRSDGSFSENSSQSNSVCNYSHEQEKCGQGKSQCDDYNEEKDKCVSYDEILVNSDEVIELDEEEGGGDHGTLAVPVECDDLGPPEMPQEIEIQDSTSLEEMGSRLDENVPKKPSHATETPSSSSSSSASGMKSLENVKPIIPHDVHATKASTKRHDVTPKAASRRTKGSSLSSSNSKANVDAKSQKESRPKKTVESQPQISKKNETRTPIATSRCKTSTNSAKLEMSIGSAAFRFKSSERAEKRKEFYMKLEEKIHAKKTETNQVQAKTQQKAEAEMKQFRKSLNFKATPMPSFYNTDSRPASHIKTEPSKVAPSRPRQTTSPLVTNPAVTKISYKQSFEEGKMVKKVIVGNRKQSAAKDSNLQKGNLLAVETKQKIGARKSGNLNGYVAV